MAAPPPAAPTPVAALTAAGLEQRFNTQIKPLLVQHCFKCHGNGKKKADIDLDPYTNLIAIQNGRTTWRHIQDVINQKLMPPEDKPALKPEELSTISTWLDDALNFCDCTGPRNPGRVAIHRLNRTEYNHTVQDLLYITDFRPADDFPSDDSGYGFDNIADVLSMSPLLAEKYLAAAEAALDKAIPTGKPPSNAKRIAENTFENIGEGNQGGNLQVNGEAYFSHEFAKDGQYSLRIRAAQDKFGDEDARMVVKVDDKEIKAFDVPNLRTKPGVFEVKTTLKAGKHKIAAAYTNNKVDNKNLDRRKRGDRNLHLDWIEVEGPLNAPPPAPPESRTKLLFATPGQAGLTEDAAARQVLARFAARAFRRPVQNDEIDAILKVYKATRTAGEPYEPAIKVAMSAVMVSPHFLYRIEQDPANAAPGSVNRINDYELATRLSYFLWSSGPDDQLFLLAYQGKLRDPVVFTAQVKRMLADPRSEALVANFVGQWLEIRLLDDWQPDMAKYPSWDKALRDSMKRETELFIANLIKEDRPVTEMLTADYTFINERLAKHYGIGGVQGNNFRKVSLAGSKRGGVLTQGSVLTVTAMTSRTSPVKRGKFLLEQILGAPPPPPPNDVPGLDETKKAEAGATLRRRLEIHRENPACAVCHNRLDPLGFAMENFDAIGAWREKDGSFPIDPSGKLPDGTPLTGPDTLRQVLVAKKADFVHCLAEKMLTYALGRGMEYYDQCTVKDIAAATERDGYRFSALVLAIAQSDAFQKRRIPTEADLKAPRPKPPEKKPAAAK